MAFTDNEKLALIKRQINGVLDSITTYESMVTLIANMDKTDFKAMLYVYFDAEITKDIADAKKITNGVKDKKDLQKELDKL